jgi:LysM repeat protein
MSTKKIIIASFLTGILAVISLQVPTLALGAPDANSDNCDAIMGKLRTMKTLMQRKDILEAAVRKCPEDPVLLYLYAFNLERRHEYKQSLRYYRKSARINPLYPSVYFGIGEAYFALGNIDEAENAFTHGLQLQPENSWAKRRLQQILAAPRQPDRTPDGSHVARGDGSGQDAYTSGIARRYNIEVPALLEAKQQMARLKAMARQYNIQLEELISANNKMASPGGELSPSNGDAPKGMDEKAKQAREKYLSELAGRYGIKLEELTKLNDQVSSLKKIAQRYGIRLEELLPPGKKIISYDEQKLGAQKHKVRKNEYLSAIARRYGVSLEDILKANREISDPHWIFPGQVITIPEKSKGAAGKGPGPK